MRTNEWRRVFGAARIFAVVAALAASGCGEDGDGEGAGEGDSKDDDGKKGAAGERGGGEGASAEGSGVIAAETVSDCPKSLEGTEKGKHRILKKECGTVTVTEDYYVDAGSLTLEAGATLAFAEGRRLYVGYYEPAKLVAKGTAAEPARLTAAGDKAPGSWKGVLLYARAARSSLEGLVVEYAGSEEEGAVVVENAPEVTIAGSTFRETKGPGLTVRGEVTLAKVTGNTFEKNGKGVALDLEANASAALGAGNVLPADGRIHVRAGTVRGGKWANHGVPYVVLGDLYLDGAAGAAAKLAVEPGVEVRFEGLAALYVGYHEAAALTVAGTADKPVVLTSVEKKGPGDWKGVLVYGRGEATFEHATLAHAGTEAEGAITLLGGDRGRVTVRSCAFEKDTKGITVADGAAKLEAVSGSRFAGTPVAIELYAGNVAAVAADNTIDADGRIVVRGGTVGKTAAWHAPKALEVMEDVYVDGGTLTIEAGSELAFDAGKAMFVGYHEAGGLKIAGTKEKPVVLRALSPGRPWKNVVLYGRATPSSMEHVRIAGAGEGGAAAIDLMGTVEAALKDVVCDECAAAAVGRDCTTKVTLDGKAPAGKCR